jgi:hypothetical protein
LIVFAKLFLACTGTVESGQNQALFRRLFLFFEGMANSPDQNVGRELLGIAISVEGTRESVRRVGKTENPGQRFR